MTELRDTKNNINFDFTNLSRHLTTHKWDSGVISIEHRVVAPLTENVALTLEAILNYLNALMNFWAKRNPLAMTQLDILAWQVHTNLLITIDCFESAELAREELRQATEQGIDIEDIELPYKSDYPSYKETMEQWRLEEEECDLDFPTNSLRTDKPVLEDRFLAVPKQLAAFIGLVPATILQEFHALIVKGYGKLVDKVRWLWNSRQVWTNKFLSGISEWEFRKGINKLKELGLVKVRQLEKSRWDHTNHYAIDYEKLKALPLPIGEGSPIGWRTSANRLVTAHQSYRTENSPENTSKTTTSAAALKFDQESSPDLSASLKNSAKAVNEELKISVAALKFDQESSPDLSASLESSVEAVSEELKITVEDQCSAAPTEDEKIEIVEGVGIAMNPHLIRTLTNFTLEQVKAAVGHYQAVMAKGTQINNSAGWLSQCLKGKWWEQSKAPEATYAYSNVITAADQEKVETAPMPTDFSNMLKAVKQKVKQELSRSRTKSLGFA